MGGKHHTCCLQRSATFWVKVLFGPLLAGFLYSQHIYIWHQQDILLFGRLFKINSILEIVLIPFQYTFLGTPGKCRLNKHQFTNERNVVWNLSFQTKIIEILSFIQHSLYFQAVIVPILVNRKWKNVYLLVCSWQYDSLVPTSYICDKWIIK